MSYVGKSSQNRPPCRRPPAVALSSTFTVSARRIGQRLLRRLTHWGDLPEKVLAAIRAAIAAGRASAEPLFRFQPKAGTVSVSVVSVLFA